MMKVKGKWKSFIPSRFKWTQVLLERVLETCTANRKQVLPNKTFAGRRAVEKKATYTIETEEDDSI